MAANAKSLIVLLSVFLMVSSTATAQETPNQISFGYRNVFFGKNSDTARFQRHQDLRNGVVLDLFRFTKDTNRYEIKFNANRVGYRDQSYSFSYNNFGKLKISFELDQTPLFYSNSTRTLYTSSAPGVLTIDDEIQRGVENKTLTLLKAANASASLFDLKSKRSVANFNLEYRATPHMTYTLNLKNTSQKGNQPWGTNFGFTLANEVPVPIDRRTTDLGAGVELSSNLAYVRFGYDGSYFRNNIPTLAWDNPLRIATQPSMGRQSLWPNTNQNTVSASGGLKLPVQSRATVSVSIGRLSNNNPLIPFTVNPALPIVPLSREMSEIMAKTLAMNYTFTSRPVSWLFVNTRYRQYKLDNGTEPFVEEQTINYDTSLVTRHRESEPLSFNRRTLDTDVTWSPISYLGLRAGFTREAIDRTHRVVEETVENTGRMSVDLTGISWLSLRGVYERSARNGSPIHQTELLALGQQPSLRQFDISDRDKDRFNLLLVVTPLSQLSFNASTGIGQEDYPAADTRTVFGLRSNNNRSRSFGFDFTPVDSISFGASYGFEKYNAFQVSRTANPLAAGKTLTDPTQQFNDPRRDWTTDSADRTETFNLSTDLLKLIPKTDIKLSYDDIRSRSTYVYGLTPNTVIPAPVQLPAVTNRLKQSTVDSRYFVSKNIAFGLTYRFDEYSVNDFTFNPRSNLAEPTTAAAQNYMMLGYFQRPYKANTVICQFSYFW